MSGFATIPLCPKCGGFWHEPKDGCASDFHPTPASYKPDFYNDATWGEPATSEPVASPEGGTET